MRTSYFPSTDSGLLAWSANFSSEINIDYAVLGLSQQQTEQYAAVHAVYKAALAACDPSIRSKVSVVAKNGAMNQLKNNARSLVSLINGNTSVSDSQKTSLGMNVRSKPTANPVPENAPAITVVSVSAWTVKIKIRARPAFVSGASLFSYVGQSPPVNMSEWTFEGNYGRKAIDVQFPSTLSPGTRVWVSACWFNGRKQSGPSSQPVGTNLQGGGVLMNLSIAA